MRPWAMEQKGDAITITKLFRSIVIGEQHGEKQHLKFDKWPISVCCIEAATLCSEDDAESRAKNGQTKNFPQRWHQVDFRGRQ